MYIYGLAFPILLWLGLRYLGVGEWSIVEAVAVWGYAQFVWIPVSVCAYIPRNHSEASRSTLLLLLAALYNSRPNR